MTRQPKNKTRAETGTSNTAIPSNPNAVETLSPTELCNLSIFDPQRMLAMERMLSEVVQKNQELENANLQLHSRVFELESNQNQSQTQNWNREERVAATATAQNAADRIPDVAAVRARKSQPTRPPPIPSATQHSAQSKRREA